VLGVGIFPSVVEIEGLLKNFIMKNCKHIQSEENGIMNTHEPIICFQQLSTRGQFVSFIFLTFSTHSPPTGSLEANGGWLEGWSLHQISQKRVRVEGREKTVTTLGRMKPIENLLRKWLLPMFGKG
jgi:hypothetical protein